MDVTGTTRARIGAVLVTAVLIGSVACSSSTPASAPATTAAPTTAPGGSSGSSGSTTPKLGNNGATPGAGGAAAATFEGTPDIVLNDFKPEVNGFGFENYTNKTAPSNLTAEELKKFWGDQVCASQADGKCTLTPPAEKWMSEINDAMGGGHCEGMAVLALMFIKGQVSLKDFGDASTANGLKLDGNEKLAKEIAYWWAMQATTPLTSSRLDKLKPSEVAAKLKESFQPGATDAYTFAFFKTKNGERSGGHAVTPYGMKDRGDGKVDVAVYDNNFPNQARALSIDTVNEKWSYNTATNPTEPPDLYEGDATTLSLWLAPIGARLQKQDCPFCGTSSPATAPKFAGAAAGDADAYNQLFLSQAAGSAGVEVTITDLDGKPIPGLKELMTFSGEGIPPVQQIPAGLPFRVKLDGTDLKEPIATDLTLIGVDVDQYIDGINLDPGQTDTIEFRPKENSITYETDSNESPTIGSGFSDPGAAYAVAVGGVDLPEGGKVELKQDLATGLITITTQRTAKGTYAFAIDRISDTGDDEFVIKGVDIPVGFGIELDYGHWEKSEQLQGTIVSNGNRTPVTFDNEA